MGLVAICLIAACEHTAEGIRQDAQELRGESARQVEAAEDEAAGAARRADVELEAFKRRSTRTLEKIDDEIEVLEERIEALGSEARDEARAKLARLEEQRAELRREMAELRYEAGERWDSAKQRIERSVDALGRQVESALSELGAGVRRTTERTE